LTSLSLPGASNRVAFRSDATGRARFHAGLAESSGPNRKQRAHAGLDEAALKEEHNFPYSEAFFSCDVHHIQRFEPDLSSQHPNAINRRVATPRITTMTSSARFFAIQAILVSAALTMTAGLASAADNTLSKNMIIEKLKGAPVTRSLSADPKKQEETTFINSLRNRQTRSLSMDERNQLENLTLSKPQIDMEIKFDYNSASISQSSMPAVQQLGEALSDPKLQGSTFVVSGHTDAIGGEAFNQDLSERRADTIKKYLVDNYHIAAGDLVTVGYGKSHLKDPAHPDAAVNRRVQVVNTETQNTASK
jgi:outer membrane protein OmpA-like peptidoglycan-associated protein